MPSFTWEPGVSVTGRYRNAQTGRFVSPAVVRAELDAYLSGVHEPVTALADALRNGQINLMDWQIAMREQIKLTHLNAVAEAVGGYQNMTLSDYGRAGQLIREQYGYLQQFAQDIESGKQRLDGSLGRRAKMYTDAGRRSYYKALEAAIAQGRITHIASVLNPADHCGECVALNGRWYRIDSGLYNPPGNRECRTNCKCSEKYGIEQANGTIKEVGTA